MTLEDLSNWTEKHCRRPELGPFQKRTLAVSYIPAQLPEGHNRDTTVRDPDHPRLHKWCYFLASNKTQEDMDALHAQHEQSLAELQSKLEEQHQQAIDKLDSEHATIDRAPLIDREQLYQK